MKNLEELIDTVQEELDYEYSLLRVGTKETIGRDIMYRAKVTKISEVREFNFHSDYWGTAETYEEQNVTAMRHLRSYIGKVLEYEGKKVKLLAMLIDKQYNSIGHTELLVEEA